MKGEDRPLPNSTRWLMRIFGVLLPAAACYFLPQILAAVRAIRQGSGKGAPLSKEAMTHEVTVLSVYGGIILVALIIGIWLILRSLRKASAAADAPATESAPLPVRKAHAQNQRWSQLNVVQVLPEARRLWQFDGSSFSLNREQSGSAGEPLPAHMVAKSWNSFWQRKLNVAWLPPEDVFIRVAQFPLSSLEETRAMVELQLEKLSPIPVTQAIWNMQILPHSAGNMQTVLVLIVPRSSVEEFLGKLEQQGYLADRLELPLLDQLEATVVREDGAWIYPEAQGGKNTALVAWWYGGVLQSVNLLTLSAAAETNRAASLKDQLTQMAWAGELEGWLTAPPRWHVVTNDGAADWVAPLKEGLDQPVEVQPPLPDKELAARTARRAAQGDPLSTLLPLEFVTRYRQQFVDRLWMRGLGAVISLYLIGLVIYFIALGVLNYKTNAVEMQVKGMGGSYTNSLQEEARYNVLKERQDLKFAALDCWEAVAETLPTSITLDSMNFSGGKKLLLSGTAPADQVGTIIDFSDKLRKQSAHGQNLFRPNPEPPKTQVIGGSTVRWSYELELLRTGGL